MKCEYFVIREGGFISRVVIETGKVTLNEEGNEENLDVDFKESFNTLISVFSLKNSWKKEKCFNPVYQVNFVKENCKETFQFEVENLPDNWSMFLAYISKLVGDAL